MLRPIFSPLRIFWGILAIGVAIFIYLALNPRLTVTPSPTADSSAVYGMMFNLKNSGVVTLREVSSTICVNSVTNAGQDEGAGANVAAFGNAHESVGLSDLDFGDEVALPFENVMPGPPGSKADLVFIVRFHPGWFFWEQERRFRFSGTELAPKRWDWKPMPLEGPCA